MPTKLLISQLLLIRLELAIDPPPQNIYGKPHSYYTCPLTVKRRPDISNIISGMERRKIILQEKKLEKISAHTLATKQMMKRWK